jgi:aspartate/methionine/tyrosine aminotransferase
MHTNDQLKGITGSASIRIADRVRQLEAEGQVIAKLQTGEPGFNTPDSLIEACIASLKGGATHYSASQGEANLRQAIASSYNDQFSQGIEAKNVLISVGAIHAVFCSLFAVLNHDDAVLIPEPYWPQYAGICQMLGAEVVPVDTRASHFRLTADQIEAHLSKRTRVLILNNPVNPTGIVYSATELNSFLDLAIKHDLILLVDEVYNRIIYDRERFSSILSLERFSQATDRIIYVSSFSKTFAMTGWRLGYAILPNELLSKALLVSQHTATNVSQFVQAAGVAALSPGPDIKRFLNLSTSLYQSRRQRLIELLELSGLPYVRPDGAFYGFVNCGEDASVFAERLLDQEKIAVVPGSAYGNSCQDYFRISFAVDERSFDAFCQWLQQKS